jgi:peptidoglycan/xylan/chitin deacetylase (PgdA/CDA1 family)
MAFSRSTHEACAVLPGAALPSIPSQLARVRSRLVRETAALAFPRSILLTHGARNRARKCIALTFDDGPDEMTSRYLDLLSRLGVRATFFLVGQNIACAPGLVAEYARSGHELGGHGWTHKSFTKMNGEELRGELERTHSLLAPYAGRARLVRPPRGTLSLHALLRLAALRYTAVLWSIDSDDCRTRDPRVVEQRLAPGRVASGDIVLLHELQPWTIEALPGVVDAFRRDGWELVTVSELLGPDAGWAGRSLAGLQKEGTARRNHEPT